MLACNAFWPKHLKTLHHNHKKSQDPPFLHSKDTEKGIKENILVLKLKQRKSVLQILLTSAQTVGFITVFKAQEIYPHL